MIRQTVHFEGRVQGVGFRWRTTEVAQRHAVTGTVQNLPDGRVKLVAEGQVSDVKTFVADVLSAMAGNIKDHTVDQTPATGQWSDFSIVR